MRKTHPHDSPALSVVIPSFNNVAVLRRCLESWQQFAPGEPVEILVIEDGCGDETPDYLKSLAQTPWGDRHLRWFHEDNAHELKCTNRGFAEGRAALLMTWQDDMFLRSRWFVGELVATFDRYPQLGLLSLSRGLICLNLDQPIQSWEDLNDWRRLQSTIGPAPLNWFCLQEIDAVLRPWVVRRACLDRVGLLDEAFCPTEWDEADLCFRIRQAGWKTATHGYERAGAYEHLGSSTLTRTHSERYKQRVLANGLLFHERWDDTIRREQTRHRRRWRRRSSLRGWMATLRQMARFARRRTPQSDEVLNPEYRVPSTEY